MEPIDSDRGRRRENMSFKKEKKRPIMYGTKRRDRARGKKKVQCAKLNIYMCDNEM